MPTGNTLEMRHWCKTGITPWLNGLLAMAPEKVHSTLLPVIGPLTVECTEASGFWLLKAIGAIEIIGYLLLWIRPQFGAFWLTVFMGFALHFHISHLGVKPQTLVIQIVLFLASFTVLYLEVEEEDHAVAYTPRKKSLPSNKKED